MKKLWAWPLLLLLGSQGRSSVEFLDHATWRGCSSKRTCYSLRIDEGGLTPIVNQFIAKNIDLKIVRLARGQSKIKKHFIVEEGRWEPDTNIWFLHNAHSSGKVGPLQDLEFDANRLQIIQQ